MYYNYTWSKLSTSKIQCFELGFQHFCLSSHNVDCKEHLNLDLIISYSSWQDNHTIPQCEINHLYSTGLRSVLIKITLNPCIHTDTYNPTWFSNNFTNNFLAIQESWKFHCWIIWVYHFWQLLKAAQCAHMLQAACLFWSAPLKSIHCYSSPPSMSVCLSEWYSTYFGWCSQMPCGGQAMKNMNYES